MEVWQGVVLARVKQLGVGAGLSWYGAMGQVCGPAAWRGCAVAWQGWGKRRTGYAGTGMPHVGLLPLCLSCFGAPTAAALR